MPDAYAGDRGDPTVPKSSYKLLFDAYYLKLMSGGGSVLQAWHARSGKPVAKMFDYTPARQTLAGHGPIPEGEYWIRPDQMSSKPGALDKYFRDAWPEAGWGNFRVIIHPYPKTVTYGRGGMFIHGGAVWGSAGCVDLTYGIDSFAARVASVRNQFIPLTVAYNGTTTVPPP